ncbi:hypothetical protein GOP47_0024598 [Adiantum capillus-veneris]|uniref:Uncharacterized protein n=1 Tax=Adiantum capillus-veneris TaxID=13818 RepID=A0A9D4U2E3_ADICA|nr:hypothetical protein GOP47_0024598 [Adiantum capillus-veneris]
MQAEAFTLSGFHMMGIEEQNDLRVSQCGTACDQSYTGNLPNVSSDMLDTNPESGNLEEELERIIMLADNIREKALSTTEILAGDIAIRSQKGKKDSKRSSVTSLVLRRSRKSLRPGCADNSSTLLHRQPRLSPLAARAALAAAVTPLRQAKQTNLSAKSQGLSLHSASCKAGTSFIKKNNRYNQVKRQKTGISVRQNYRNTSTCKQSPGPPVKESASFLLNQCEQDIQLTVDIPVYRDQVAEKAMNLIVDVPLLGRQ